MHGARRTGHAAWSARCGVFGGACVRGIGSLMSGVVGWRLGACAPGSDGAVQSKRWEAVRVRPEGRSQRASSFQVPDLRRSVGRPTRVRR